MPHIYEPAEDSYLLSSVLEKHIQDPNSDLTCLEIGIGSGIQLRTLRDLGVKSKNILGIDINPEAVRLCKKQGFKCLNSNLFKALDKDRGFDIIIFNPPYLPEDDDSLEPEDSQIATTGGESGGEVINEFLKQAKDHLNENGRIFLLTSSLTKGIDWLDYKKKLLTSKKIFFEELFVYELAL